MIGRGHVTLGHKGELHHKSMQFQSIRKEKKWLRLELHILDLLTLAIRTGCPNKFGIDLEMFASKANFVY